MPIHECTHTQARQLCIGSPQAEESYGFSGTHAQRLGWGGRGSQLPNIQVLVRAWWEIPREVLGLSKEWATPARKSSTGSPFLGEYDIPWVLRWADNGAELLFHRSYPKNLQYFGRPGVTYPARSYLGFNPRAFRSAPDSATMSHFRLLAHSLGIFASRPLEYVLSFSNGSQGDLKAYPKS